MNLHQALELLVAIAALLAPAVTGWISSRMRADFASFQLALLKELNGRYVWRREWDAILHRLDNIEQQHGRLWLVQERKNEDTACR